MLSYDIENTINSTKEKSDEIQDIIVNINNDDTNYGGEASAARKRWKILARAIKQKGRNCSDDKMDRISDDECIVSVRRFNSFDLVQQDQISTEDKENLLGHSENWYTYKLTVNSIEYMVNIHHINRPVTAADLMGFNYTGNVCVWPSEEALAYYCMSNVESFNRKTIIELGGGMTCLAGLLIAKYAKPHGVHLTDGNALAVENVKRTCRLNDINNCYIKCSVLKWEQISLCRFENEKFDYILCADCLFFDDARSALVDAIWHFLSDTGICLVMAPRRGNTFDLFLECATQKGLVCNVIARYDERIWERHLELKKSNFYEENIHYPILVQLTKSK